MAEVPRLGAVADISACEICLRNKGEMPMKGTKGYQATGSKA